MNDVDGSRHRLAPPNLRTEWEGLRASMPDSVKEAVTPELWDLERLHALNLPVQEVPIVELAWLFDVPLWAVDGVPFQVTPNEVRVRPEAFRDQFVRTMASDLAWPIHIRRFRGRWIVLDGVHRLLKADMLGESTIQAMKLPDADYASIVFSQDGL